jgi:hypothetical protein
VLDIELELDTLSGWWFNVQDSVILNHWDSTLAGTIENIISESRRTKTGMPKISSRKERIWKSSNTTSTSFSEFARMSEIRPEMRDDCCWQH